MSRWLTLRARVYDDMVKDLDSTLDGILGDGIIDDEDNHVLPINDFETGTVNEEKSDLTKIEGSNSSTKSTESSADPFKRYILRFNIAQFIHKIG